MRNLMYHRTLYQDMVEYKPSMKAGQLVAKCKTNEGEIGQPPSKKPKVCNAPIPLVTPSYIDCTDRWNLAKLHILMAPLQRYVDQGDLAHKLSLKTEERQKNLCVALKHQQE